ncbi:MAG: WD40/YVTN/BNR-like repeat-containing protein, partial [Terriglobales bacterium]
FCAAQGSIPCQGVYDLYVAAPPGGAGLVVAGIDVWTTASLSGAKTAWTNLTRSYTNGVVHPDQHAIAFLDGQHWFIGNDGGVWRTADSGADWTDLNASLNTIQFMSVSAVGGGVYLGGSQDNGTALSAAGGTGWNLIWGGDGGDTAVSPSNAQELLTENYDVSLQHSEDGGKTFNPVVTSATITGPSDFYVPYELAPSKPSQVLLGASGVWQGPADPTGSGVGWAEVGALSASSSCQLVPKDVITALAAAPSSPDVIYAGFADGQLYVTDNATTSPTWSSIDGPTFAQCSPPLPIGALAVSPADPNTVYIGIQGLGLENSDLGHVYKSTDGGKTLTDITGNLPDVPVNSIIVDPSEPSDIYVADDLGVFVASDGGSSGEQWERLGTGLPAAAVLQIALTSGANPSIVAATHGRGAWVIPATAPPNFTLSITPSTQTLTNTNTATFTIQTTTVNGYSGNLTLSCTAPASGCSFSPATIAAGASATLTVDATQLSGGTITVTVQATDGTLTRTATAALVMLGFSLNGDQTSPVPLEAGAPAAKDHLYVQGYDGYSGTVTLSCPSLPPDIQCSFNPASVTLASTGTEFTSVIANLSASAAAAAGAGSVTIAASDGVVKRTIVVPVNVAGFSVSVPSQIDALAGTDSISAPVTVSTLSDYTGTLSLACQAGAPLACSVTPAAATPGTPVTLTITGMSKLSDGNFASITVTATGGSETRTASAIAELSDFTLNPMMNSTEAVLPGVGSLSFPVDMSFFGDFSSPVTLSCAGLAAPAACSFSTNPVQPPAAGITLT